MIGLSTLKALHETKGDRTEPETVHRQANTYWMLFIVLGGVALILAIAFGVRQFLVPPPEQEAGPTVSEGTATYDGAQLKTVLKALQDRGASFDALSQ